MNPRVSEALNLLQEECAEVIVEISKCRRFGLDTVHSHTKLSHTEMLQQEVGDVLALVDILVEEGIIDTLQLQAAKERKQKKLKQWSNLYENQSQ